MKSQISKLSAIMTALFAIMAAGLPGGGALAQNRVIVLDATNSMWGPIAGGRKYQIARDAVTGAAGSLSSQSQLGLYVIGNQPDAGCEALGGTLPLGPVDRDALEAALDAAIPDRGRMPLIPAIERAAQALQDTGGPGRILVIGDGAGTCVPDACAAARGLSDRDGELAIDAVSLDADADTRERMQCMTRETGGAYLNAESREEVVAFVRKSLAGENAPAAPRPRPEARQAEPVPPLPGINPFRPGQSPVVTLRAVLTEGREPLAQGLAWRIYEPTSAGEEGPEVWRGAAAQPEVNLPTGRYRVEVRHGLMTATRDIEVRPRRGQTITIDLEAAVLNLAGAERSGEEPVQDIFYYVHELGPDGGKTGALVARSSQPKPRFTLPAGRYEIIARHGFAEARDTVELEAGSILGRNLALDAGTLRVEASLAEGQPAPRGTMFFIHERAGDDWRELARSARRTPSFTLPTGRYQVEARLDAAQTSEVVEIAAGDDEELNLRLPAGRLRIETRLDGRDTPLQSGVVYRIFQLDGGEASLIQTSAQAPFEGFVPTGRYRVISAYGEGNVAETQEVTVNAGQTHSLTFTHEAGQAQLGLVKAKGGLTLGRVNWSIRDSAGAEIFTSNDTVPEPYLRAGQYVAIAERQGETVREAFTISSNQRTVVELVAR